MLLLLLPSEGLERYAHVKQLSDEDNPKKDREKVSPVHVRLNEQGQHKAQSDVRRCDRVEDAKELAFRLVSGYYANVHVETQPQVDVEEAPDYL